MTVIPSKSDIERILCERHTPEVHNVIKKARIGIAGLGGLGSNVAVMLVRAGVSELVIADMDTVDLSNINRQNYCLEHIGIPKTDAAEQMLRMINPYVTIEKHNVRLGRSNIPGIFKGCDVVCEAFDTPSEKAMLINTILEECPGTKAVSGSGMAGYGRSNEITTKRLFDGLYICGDGIDMENVAGGLMAPRVNICAGHMANAVLALLLKGKV
ncbi:MAG: sulfur carrier protein ThiS adenylyltransferase ThiF [Methanomassiliicoccaceae archaeon]|jgi:sulfur carrier protein ThiS adenylyltransferase|nr:sulfur carrier protein ThiS adenylyltransferase ThiF [Methanomassiliicoccaceae archaeon]